MSPVSWIAAQIPAQYHGQEVTPTIELNMFEDAVNNVSLHSELTNIACDANFRKALDNIRNEWRWGTNIISSKL